MKTKLIHLAAWTIACAFLAGCASQTTTEREFGDSVRATTQGQIHDIGAALYPNKEAVTGGNPDRLENVVKTHYSAPPSGSRVEAPISMGVGNSTK